MWIEVLVEGASDVPVLREILVRHFGLVEDIDFRIHPHRGRGKLPANPLARPDIRHQGLLDQLPAKLRGFGKSLPPDSMVLVVVDVDDDPWRQLLNSLHAMLQSIPTRPQVLFRLAIEETESWFIADLPALQAAYPTGLKKNVLKGIKPDAIVGAWEKLALALGIDPQGISPTSKYEWATKIAPHLDFDNPPSPSLGKLVVGLIAVAGDQQP